MKTRLSVLIVLALLAPLLATAVTRADAPVTGGAKPFEGDCQPAPWKVAAPEAGEITYFVEWNIRASGYSEDHGSDYTTVTKRQIKIIGEALVHESVYGGVRAIPMDLTITDDRYRNSRWRCEDEHEWRSITDPGRYNGGPDPFWMYPGIFWPEQRDNGSWYMDNPFSDWSGFTVNGQLNRVFNYRTDTKTYDLCGWDDYVGSYTNEMMYYDEILRYLRDKPLEGDPTGTIFRLDTEYTVDTSDPPLTVNFHATVRVGGCKDLPAPIDFTNPGITFLELNLQAEDTTPDAEATLQARVTCQGVPVINAPVEVTLKAVEGSGGHEHVLKRPRGYIDGVEITSADTRVTGLTNSDGAVTFMIGAGRDLTDKSRGIAGWYIADALVRWERVFLPPPTNRAYINAHYDLVPLDSEDILYIIDWSDIFKGHITPVCGTPQTLARLEEAAQLWIDAQNLHNSLLIAKGKPGWPVCPFQILAISLPKGGLLDAQVWMPNHEWRPPFDRHRTGEEVLFEPYYLSFLSREQVLWYQRVFRDLGNLYGTWFTDFGHPFNLKVTQAPANLSASAMLAPNNSRTVDPDVAASAALVDPAARFVAGAGQTVTCAVGVENVAPGTEAGEVVLRAALPAGLSFISADPPPSRMEDSGTPIWDIGSLPDEDVPRTFDVIAQIDPSTAVGTLLTVTATATTSSLDANPANNQFSDWGLTVQQPGSDLVIGSDLDATALTAGEPVSFTILLSNEGNAPASNSWFDLTVPTGITITAVSPTANVIPGGVRWEAGVLAPGEAQTSTVGLHVDPALLDLAAPSPDMEPEYPLQFLMTAGSESTDIDPASNQMQVDKRVELAGPDLLVALQAQGTPGPGVFEVGQEVTYALRYANFGNRSAGGGMAALLLWPGLVLLESQPVPTTNQLDTTSGVRTLTWNVGDLSIGGEGTIELRLRVDDVPEVGSIIRADISSNDIDLNPADNVVMETRYEAYTSTDGAHKVYLPVVMRQ